MSDRSLGSVRSVRVAAETARRIAIFLPSLRGGGAERAMLQFAGGLLQAGIEVDLVVAQARGPLLRLVPAGTRLIDLRSSRVLFALLPLIRYLRQRRPSAIYSTIMHANIIAVIAARWSGIRLPVIIRESNAPKTARTPSLASKIVLRALPYFYPRADAIIAVSEGVKGELIDMNPSLAGRIRTCPTPVISEALLREADEHADHPWLHDAKIPYILGMGRLHPQKDFPTLLRAFAAVRRQRQVRLIILGDGAERRDLIALARALGVEEDVSFPGFKENPFPYLKRARTFVLSSRYEGMPNVLVQAMALGVPVVATDCVSGPREVTRDGQLGMLVPVGDVTQLADAIERSLERTVADDVALEIRERFGVNESVRAYLDVLENVA